MDYYKLSSDFLKTMRGEVPQRELSAALGYSYNKIGKLESGANQIKWDEFIKIAEKCNYPILNNLNSFFYHFEGEHISIEFYNYLTNIYSLGTTSSVQLKSLVSKWKKGNPNPDLAEILQIIDSRPSMLAGFFNVFKVGRYLPQLTEELQLLNTKVNLLSREPIIGYINAALYIEEYKNLEIHNDEVLAQHSSCSIAN
jgi:transcriptional regulator with XRE-family HTH domain